MAGAFTVSLSGERIVTRHTYSRRMQHPFFPGSGGMAFVLRLAGCTPATTFIKPTVRHNPVVWGCDSAAACPTACQPGPGLNSPPAAFRDLLACFSCEKCESWLYVTPPGNPETIRCRFVRGIPGVAFVGDQEIEGVNRDIQLLGVDRRASTAQAVRAFASFEAKPGLKFDQVYEAHSQRFHREDS